MRENFDCEETSNKLSIGVRNEKLHSLGMKISAIHVQKVYEIIKPAYVQREKKKKKKNIFLAGPNVQIVVACSVFFCFFLSPNLPKLIERGIMDRDIFF